MNKKTQRQELIEQRLNMPDRLERADLLQRVMRIWLVGRPDTVIGAPLLVSVTAFCDV